MYLFIATAERKESHIFLVKNGKIVCEKNISLEIGRRNVLKDIDDLLAHAQTKPSAIKGIAVVSGPGQFSCLRTGIIIANTFGFVLSIPVAPIQLSLYDQKDFLNKGLARLARTKKFSPCIPAYGSEPNISKPKVRGA